MTWSHARNAAGICAICAGLMLGTNGAIAAADPSSNDSGPNRSAAHTEHRTRTNPTRKTEIRTSAETVGRLTDAVQKTIHDVVSVFGSGRIPGQLPTIPALPSKPVPVIPNTTTGANHAKSASGRDAGTSTPGTTGSVPSTVTPGSVTSGSTTPGSTDIVPPVDNAPVVVVPPVTTPATPVVTATPIPWIIKPVDTVITTIQYVVNAAQYVVNAAVYTVGYTVGPIASDLSSLLGVGALMAPSVDFTAPRDTITSAATPGGVAFVSPSVITDVPGSVFPTVAGVAGVPTVSATDVAAPSAIDPASSNQKLALTGEVPLANASDFPASLKRFFEHAVSSVLRSPSLSALAALALPGFLGLLIIAGAGVRFGYRQAKAALALPASKLARFAAPQPLRLVRSRNAITLSLPASRFVPRELSSAKYALENAA